MNLLLASRADFGFGNPNLAGVLFAMLAAGVWGWVMRTNGEPHDVGGRHGLCKFWLGLGGGALFAGLMVLTASRGAVVALVLGVLASWSAARFPRPRRWQAGGLLAAMVFLGVLAGGGRLGGRTAESSLRDESITCRIAIFQAVPALLTAAPQGWGVGQSSEAYQNWFQDREDTRRYKHLLSTHATWMVERGWEFRFFYILGWAVVLTLCAAAPASLGVWVVYGVAGFFSHVGGDWRLGVLPGLALGMAVWRRMQTARWPRGWTWRMSVLVAGVATTGLALAGIATNPGVVRTGESVRVGSENPKVWVFAPDVAVLGKTYGKIIRDHAPVGVAWEMDAISKAEPDEIILSGSAPLRTGDRPPAPCVVTWLNPPARLNAAQKRFLEGAAKKTILWGELRTDANPGNLQTWFKTLPETRWIFIQGKGRFLDDSF